MKYLASIVAGLFIVLGMFVPPTVRSQSEPPSYFHNFGETHPLNTELRTIAKAKYTISFYQDYIYSHESGWRTEAVNSIGCRGLGQACPGSKLTCGDHDFDCQFDWFNKYALRNYGSWENAYYFWIDHRWW